MTSKLIPQSRGTSRLGLALLASTALGVLAPVAVPTIACAQDAGVDALVKQAQYWRSKGREDLAQQALRRARAINPNHPALKASAAKPAAAPAVKPAPAKVSAASAKAGPAKPAPAKPTATKAEPARAAAAPTSAPAPSSAANRAGQARVAGFDALDDGNLSSAAAQFQRALSVNRRDPDALGGLGLVRLRQGNFAEAAGLLGQASSLGKASQWASGLETARFFAGIDEARSLLAQGRTGDAQSAAESLVRSGYAQPGPALELLADVYEKQGRYADAADLYRQAGQSKGEAKGPDGAANERRLQLRAVRGRALAAAEQGDDLGATREFQNGLVLDPTDPWIRYEFATFQIKRGRIPEAESLLRSLTLNGSPDALYAAALLNNDLGRAAEAERLISMIPEVQRTAPMRNLAIGVKTDSAIARARTMAHSGQQGQAISALRDLGSMASVPVGKQAAVASALYDLGDSAGAVQVAQAALTSPAATLDDYEGLIGVLARAGREDLAQMGLQRAGQLAGSTADGQRAYARMSAGLMVSQADSARLAGRFAESFDILQSAYAAAPDNPEILMALGRLYEGGGMAARAAQTYQLVLARKAGDKDALLGLASAAQAAGDNDLSRQASRQALASFPQDYQVRISLAQVEKARGNDRAAMGLLKEARELYQRQQGAMVAAGGNPFAGFSTPTGVGNANPFRNQPVTAAPMVNPFALSGGTRLPAAYPGTASQAGMQGYAPSPATGGSGFGSGYAPNPASGYANGPAAFASGGSYAAEPVAASRWGAAPAASYPVAAAATGYPAPAYGGDPVMAQIQGDLASLAQDTAPRVDVETSYRQRSGEEGLSKLDEIKGSATISTGALNGRVFAKAEATVIDAGKPSGSGLARFGLNGLPEAVGIVLQQPSDLSKADTQNASGVALSAGYRDDTVQVEAGTTPIGIGKTKFAFRAAVTPRIGENLRASAMAERKPVTDSVLSYAGTRDPVTGELLGKGERWGQVMRTAGGLGLSYDANGSGVYGEGRYYRFRGTNVVNNEGFEANVGGYLRAYRGPRSSLTVGLNVNYQAYDKSQNYFTFGNGGYFSPQSFISVGFPVNYALDTDRIEARASFTPGFQSYREEESPLYPNAPVVQDVIDYLKEQNDDVRSHYDSISKTGFALSASGSLYYKIGQTTRIGGETSYNTFGSYNEFRSLFGVRQSLGSTGK